MADYFPAEIHIGGPIPKAALTCLIEAILKEGGSLEDYGGPEPTQDAVLDALKEGAIVKLYDPQACYGEFDALEAFLVEQGIHFDRHSDSNHEFNAENVHNRGGSEPLVMLSDQNGIDLVRCQEVLDILQDSSACEKAKLDKIRYLVAPPETASPLSPIRFI